MPSKKPQLNVRIDADTEAAIARLAPRYASKPALIKAALQALEGTNGGDPLERIKQAVRELEADQAPALDLAQAAAALAAKKAKRENTE